MSTQSIVVPKTQSEWRKAFESLPSNPPKIPAFFFAHGSPMLAFSESTSIGGGFGSSFTNYAGGKGPLATFLKDFGPMLLQKYKPSGIVVFSAHWETTNERVVTDYGDDNPLLYDYYGFQPELYKLQFKSRGDSTLAQRIVDLYKSAGKPARKTTSMEPRGQDGRGFAGPGLDHGVFIPFRLMFGEVFMNVPIVQVSIDASLDPEVNWEVGKAVAKLREEGVLVLSGGLTVHNLRDMSSFMEASASSLHKSFDQAILDAVLAKDLKSSLVNLTYHPGFRAAHPREDHFIPLYVAAGAGEDGDVKILNGCYGTHTFAFGV